MIKGRGPSRNESPIISSNITSETSSLAGDQESPRGSMDAGYKDSEIVSAGGNKLDSKEPIVHEPEASSVVEKSSLNQSNPRLLVGLYS